MKTLSEIHRQLANGEFEFSRHAFRRVVERNISEREIREAGSKAESSKSTPKTNIRRAPFSWDLPLLAGLCIFKYRLVKRR